MKGENQQNLMILILVVFLMALTSSASGQSSREEVLRKTVSLSVKNGSLLYVLSTLSADSSIPIGFEIACGDQFERSINIEVKETSLKNVLDIIVERQPRYRWELSSDGVVNILPIKEDRHPLIVRLLDLKIKYFTSSDATDNFALRDELLKLPEVRNLITSERAEISGFVDSPSSGIAQSYNRLVESSEVSFRTLLNRLVKERMAYIWVINLTKKNKLELSL